MIIEIGHLLLGEKIVNHLDYYGVIIKYKDIEQMGRLDQKEIAIDNYAGK